jgi:hypothetical protein
VAKVLGHRGIIDHKIVSPDGRRDGGREEGEEEAAGFHGRKCNVMEGVDDLEIVEKERIRLV